jgi:hypothetical protein
MVRAISLLVYTQPHPVLVVEKGEPPHFLHDPRLTPWQNFCSEGLASATVKNVFYPLEVAQTLMQTKSPDARDGIIPTILHLYNTYGFSSLFRGNIAANISGNVLALGGYTVGLIMDTTTFENRIAILLASVVPAQLLVAALYPLQVAKVRMITAPSKYVDLIQTINTIHEEEGPRGLFRGLGFSLVETIPALATTYAGFEFAALLFRKARQDMSIKENIIYGILGTFIAALLHYPFDTAKKMVQSKKAVSENDGVLKTLAEEGEKHGLVGLYKGFSAQFFKLPSLLVERAVFKAAQVYFLRANGYSAPHLHPALTA